MNNMFYVNYLTESSAPIEQLTFNDLFHPTARTYQYRTPHPNRVITKTYEDINSIPHSAKRLQQYKAEQFATRFAAVIEQYKTQNMATHYSTFQIPKQSGGMRTIQAPDDELKMQMRMMLFELQSFLHPCSCAFAYTRNKTIKAAMETHQKAGFEWFLHIDLHDFFGSSNPQFIAETLRKIPFFYFLPEAFLQNFIHLITLNNGLPQGTPLSPFITNLLMIPFDHAVNQEITAHRGRYTRYADDMTISTTSKNATGHMLRIIREHLTGTPYTINADKTKVSSIYGKNWNLGLMYNKDKNITVGHKNKERFRATIFEFCNAPASWDKQSSMELLGKLQYYLDIEPTYFQNLLTKYGEKFNMEVRNTIIQRIKQG